MVSRKGLLFAFEALLVLLLVPLMIFLVHTVSQSVLEHELLDAQKLYLAQDVLASWDAAGRFDECSKDNIPACVNLRGELDNIASQLEYSASFNLEGEVEEHGGRLRTVCAFRTTVSPGPEFVRVFVCVE